VGHCSVGRKPLRPRKITPSAYVENKSALGRGTYVERGARLFGNVQTNEGVHIDANAVLYGPIKIGRHSYVGPNCVIGFPTTDELNQLRQSHKKPTILGEKCIVRSGTTIYSNVIISNHVSFGHNVSLRENVIIGAGTKVGTNTVVDGSTSIGSRVSIQTGVYICTYSTIEDGVFLGPCCVFTNDKFVSQKPYKLIGPTVRKGASIGANALLFPGVVVGEGAVVGSQAMVNVDVPPRTIFVGVPARKIRDLPDDWHSSLLQN
jgi:acetyltransferase-like isoleucine patch superfamily enzyme